jgi:hypothetical protein
MNADSAVDLEEWMNSISFIQFTTISCFNLAFDRNWIVIDLSFSYLATASTAEILYC